MRIFEIAPLAASVSIILTAFTPDSLHAAGTLFEVDSLFDKVYANKKGYWTSTDFDERQWMSMVFKQFDTGKKRDLDILMDIYRPSEDSLIKRPAVILAHGGAFYVNGRRDPLPARVCEYLARNGYVAASIDYRMGFAANKKSIREAQEAARDDMRSALRYLCDSSEVLGIDTTAIVVGGSSSGAMMSMRAVFEPDSLTPPVVGVIAMWGAIPDLSVLDSTDVSLLAIHGNADKTVPYGEGYPVGGPSFMDRMYGSYPIVQRMKELGKDATLITFVGYPHSPCFTDGVPNGQFPYIMEKVLEYLQRVIPTPESRTPRN